MNPRSNIVRNAMALCLLLVSVVASHASEFLWSVEGAGWLNNRRIQRQLELMLPEAAPLSANDVEDAVMVILNSMQQKGFLDASVVTHLTELQSEANAPADASWTMRWDRDLETFFEKDVTLREVRFEVIPGPVFYFDRFEIEEDGGLESDWIESFYYKPTMLFQSDRVRLFHPGKFEKSSRNLETQLSLRGYRNAKVFGVVQQMDMETGAVYTVVRVVPGPMHRLAAVDVDLSDEHVEYPSISFESWVGQPYTRVVRQDLINTVRNVFYEKGYPDVTMEVTQEVVEAGPPVMHRLYLKVNPGPRVRVGPITLDGLQETRESFIRKKLNLQPGDWLNPVELDADRLTLSRTGLFDRVDLQVVPGELERPVRFTLQERYPWTMDLMAGWGSYEQLRLGSTLKRDNLWGQAHQALLRTVVSMKSQFGEAVYTIPDIRRSGVNLNFRTFALKREEVSFDRREQGIDLGITKRFERIGLDSSWVYAIQVLESVDRQGRTVLSDENSRVGSLSLRLNRDQRDSPITPQDGYRVFSNVEWADERLGGNVNFWNVEIGYSQHGRFGNGLFWHAGLSHGWLVASGSGNNFIPTNKLYFPGGDDSIRGYQRGEAAPRDAEGFLVGARSNILLNLELEQFLTDSISAVLFYDWLGSSVRSVVAGYDQSLESVGIGLRWKTVIGPVRLEYGHNLKPRDGDPNGTLHLALGMPF